jgi:hypothetical protein
MSPIRKPIEKVYSVALAFVEADRLARKRGGHGVPVKRQLRWAYIRIASLDAPYGQRLDALGATMGQARWVAAPGMGKGIGPRPSRPSRNADVEARFNALVALLEGRSPFASFKALVAAFPAIDPRTGKACVVAEDTIVRDGRQE